LLRRSSQNIDNTNSSPAHTCEGNHRQAAVLDLCGLEAEHLVGIIATSQVQGVKEAT
jgi:hypothetical protein